MIYVKCTLAGLLAVLAAAILLVIVVVVGLSIASRSLQSSQAGSVGWDSISLAKPFTWLAVVLGIFLVGFFLGVSSSQVKVAHYLAVRSAPCRLTLWNHVPEAPTEVGLWFRTL